MPPIMKTRFQNYLNKGVRLKTNILIFAMIVFGFLGDVLLGKGMKQIGAMVSWAPADIFSFFFRAFSTGTIWLGITSFFILFVAFVLVLSWADYSYVQPVSALSYVVIACWHTSCCTRRSRPPVGPACC